MTTTAPQMPQNNAYETTVAVYTFLSRAKYNNVPTCRRDILEALHFYNGRLKPKLDKFTFSDGRARDLIVIEGTVPIQYR